MKNLEFSGDTLLSTLDWPFSQLLECGTRIMEMNFILPHSFELDLPRVPLLSTLEVLLFDYSNTGLRKVFIRITLRRIYLNCHGILYSTDCSVVRIIWCSRPALVFVFLYGGNIPFVVSLCFASQRTPTACPCCAGSISTIGLAPFCFKSAGLALVWASAVLLWFLALLYPKVSSLSIRRVHNDIHIIFPYSTDKLDRFYNMSKSIPFIFIRQSFFSRVSPPLQLSTKLIVFKGSFSAK